MHDDNNTHYTSILCCPIDDHLDNAVLKSKVSMSVPSAEIRNSLSIFSVLSLFRRGVTTLFMQLNPRSQSAVNTGRSSALTARAFSCGRVPDYIGMIQHLVMFVDVGW